MNPDIEPILATARDLYGRVVYTHETHERERIICSAKVSTTNRRNTILATATTVLAVVSATLPGPVVLILRPLQRVRPQHSRSGSPVPTPPEKKCRTE